MPAGRRRGPGGGGLGGGGRLATHVGPRLRLSPPAVRRLRPMSRSHPGTPGARGPATGNMPACAVPGTADRGAVYPLIPACSRPKSACSARVQGSRGSSGRSRRRRGRSSRRRGLVGRATARARVWGVSSARTQAYNTQEMSMVSPELSYVRICVQASSAFGGSKIREEPLCRFRIS